MLFIATATITHTTRGVEVDTESTYPVTHLVEAPCEHSAAGMLYDHYEQLSQSESPYGDYYRVADGKAFPPLGLSTLSGQ